MHEGDGGRYRALPPRLQVGQAAEQQEQRKKGFLPATPDGAPLHCWGVRLHFSHSAKHSAYIMSFNLLTGCV